jgi:aminoglycoside phosphotransferase (APT) family kinase protein
MHPGNVLMTDHGPVVIDWITAGAGPPSADVARSILLLRDSLVPPDMPPAQRAAVEELRLAFTDAYLARYAELRDLDHGEVAHWRLPLLAARLNEEVTGEREHLLRLIDAEVGAADVDVG